MRARTIVSLVVFVMLLGGCTSTSFKSTWKNPKAQPVSLAGTKVVVVATNMPQATRLGVEAGVSDELKLQGADAISSQQVLAPNSTVADAKAKLESLGYDAAMVIRVTDKEKEVYSTPGVYAPYGGYGFYGGYGMWGGGMYSAPQVYTNTNVFIETLVYSVKLDELVWSGLSVTVNPDNIEKYSRELTRVALEEMKKSGLLK